jgi:CMD domain protein
VITDVIDHLAGIEPGSPLDLLREQRPDAREHAQRSYDALFTPESDAGVTLVERDAVAAFVTGLHGDDAASRFYADRLSELAPRLLEAVQTEIETGATTGPYGRYPADGPLSGESDGRTRWACGSPPRSSTRTCWCSGLARRTGPRSTRWPAPAGAPTAS